MPRLRLPRGLDPDLCSRGPARTDGSPQLSSACRISRVSEQIDPSQKPGCYLEYRTCVINEVEVRRPASCLKSPPVSKFSMARDSKVKMTLMARHGTSTVVPVQYDMAMGDRKIRDRYRSTDNRVPPRIRSPRERISRKVQFPSGNRDPT